MNADYLDIYTTKAVVTHYSASIAYQLADDEKVLFWDFYKEYLALQITVSAEWTDSQSAPKPEVWIKGVSILKDGSRGKKYINQFYHEGHFANDPAFRQIVNTLINKFYDCANTQITAPDSLGYIRPEYVGVN
ncbi:MAG: hypothetical protein ACK5DE_03235 [Bacteroidota bacterium]|jgi:hypothetical protein